MRAATYSAFGPAAEVLTVTEMPDPEPGPGEVKISVAFSGVNPSDVKARAGARPGVTAPPFPLICPHSDGAGIITHVGQGVAEARIGERVWIWNGQWQRPFGTAAEAIVLPETQAVALPETATLEDGASLGIPGLTAAHMVFGGGDIAGRTLLIHGGNGSVGHLAVQLARWGGARVIATASPDGFDRCRAAGAETVLDYHAPDLAGQILAAAKGQPVDRIIDVEFGENIATNADVIAPLGTIATYGSAKRMSASLPFGPLLFKAVSIEIALIYILPWVKRTQAISLLHNALRDKALFCPVAEIFPLTECALAHEAVERGHREGAILVDPRT